MEVPQECILCRGLFIYQDHNQFMCQKCLYQQKDTKVSISDNHQLACPQCTFKNKEEQIQCAVCNFLFQKNLDKLIIPTEVKKVNSMVNCSKCKFQNHLSNQYCLNCQNQLFQHIKKKCEICGFMVNQDIYKKHQEECQLSKSLIEAQSQIELPIIEPYRVQPLKTQPIKLIKPCGYKKSWVPIKPMGDKIHPISKPGFFGSMVNLAGNIFKGQDQNQIRCYYCNQPYPKQIHDRHMTICLKKQQWVKNMQQSYKRLTPLQVNAIQYMHKKSEKQHEAVRKSLQDRVKKLGFTKQDLNNLQFYTQNYAPIIIQIHVSRHMEFFVKDTHYRSQFQTNKSSGSLSRSSRTQWQSRMFDTKYDKAKDFERVKYGVINFTNDPKGVQCAKSYGPSYFLLKSHVRDRCTFTDKDSSSSDAAISTLKFGFQVISKMNDNELKAAFKASKALQESSGVLVTYKELQIHGPIQFDKDIERIYVSKDEIKGQKKLLDMVYQFSQKFKVELDFI